MDPLTALGLASNVIQIYKAADGAEIEAVTTASMQDWCNSVEARVSPRALRKTNKPESILQRGCGRTPRGVGKAEN